MLHGSLADEEERNEHKALLDHDEKGGVVPNFASGKQDSGEDDERFIELKRGEVEEQVVNLAVEERVDARQPVDGVEKQRGTAEEEGLQTSRRRIQ
jgi:hypothetical protein